ncbi:MAG: hypothetical protein JNL70_24075 [Saprospiraceae bacterium]|nr:hypothetical protein [Saprospiraceae bacterium]
MLICNNCGTVNTEGVVTCRHCHMKGYFTLKNDDPTRTTNSDDANQAEKCRNCGKQQGNGDTCMHCRFPIKRPIQLIDRISDNTLPAFETPKRRRN